MESLSTSRPHYSTALLISGGFAVAVIVAVIQQQVIAEPSATQSDNASCFAGYSLRLPAGYDAMRSEGPEGMQSFAWKGAERADGSAPYLMAMIITAPPGETEMPPVDVVLQQQLAGVERRRTDFTATKPEPVTINGLAVLGVNSPRLTEIIGVTHS